MKNPGIRLLWALGATLTVIAACMPQMVPAQSVTTVSAPFTLTVPGRGPVLNLGQGQNTCSITIYTGTSFSVTAQSASDGPNNPVVWTTATGIGTSGVITLTGTSGGTLSPGFGNTNFSFIWTGTGPLTGVESCSVGGGSGGGGGGGGGNTTIVAPTNAAGAVIVTTAAPGAALVTSTPGPIQSPTSAPQVLGENYWWNGTNWIAQSASSPAPVNVTNGTPATAFPNNVGAAPTTAPAVVSQGTCSYNTSVTAATTGQIIGTACSKYGDLFQPWSYFAITTNTVVTIKTGVGVFGGVFNLSNAAQPAGLCTFYDNTTNAGQIIFQENGIGANQQFTVPQGGVIFLTGLTEVCAVTPTTGLLVESR